MLKTKEGFVLQKMIDDYMIIAIGDAGASFRDILKTNKTGAFYWKQLEKGTTVEAMVERSLQEYEDLTPEAAKEDIEAFLKDVADAVEQI